MDLTLPPAQVQGGTPPDLVRHWRSRTFLASATERVREVLAGQGGEVHGDLRAHRTTEDWEALAEQTARMQIALAPHRDEILRSGLPALLPEHADEYVADLVDHLVHLPAADPQHIDSAHARDLIGGLADVGACFDGLAASGLPMALQPNDVSVRNACPAHGGAGPLRFIDLGDTFWSHPFAALQVASRMVAGVWQHPPPPDHPAVARLTGAYLRQWTHAGGPDELGRLGDAVRPGRARPVGGTGPGGAPR